MKVKISPDKSLLLIGQRIKVIKATNAYLVGLEGLVIFETKSMLILLTEEGIKKLIKSQVILEVNGKIIKPSLKRPVDQLKNLIKK